MYSLGPLPQTIFPISLNSNRTCQSLGNVSIYMVTVYVCVCVCVFLKEVS